MFSLLNILILWCLLSIPVSLLMGAFVRAGNPTAEH